MNKALLSQEQEAIVLFNEGNGAVLVEAAAGSGKTRILTERVRYLLTEKKDKFFSVLCLTFTNKAAQEMKDRLQGIPKLNERTFIGNFHEFCLYVIRSRYADIGFSTPPHIFDAYDCKKILEAVLLSNPVLKEVYDFPDANDDKDRSNKQRKKMQECMDFISSQKSQLIGEIPEFESHHKNWTEKTNLLFQDYNRRLREQDAMDYDDILLYAHRILARPAVANIYRRTFQYILIDEAQDLNFAQYHIIKSICGESHHNILMVGDPKQAIYGFNGSSPDFMQQHFVNDFGAEKKEINQNYRSATKVLDLAEQIQPNGGVGTNFFEGIATIQGFENEQEEVAYVIAEIKTWLQKGYYEEAGKEIKEPVSCKNIAVLARNKFVFSALIEMLETEPELKDHFYLKQGLEKFEPESDFMKFFDLGTRIIINPNSELHFRLIAELLEIELPPLPNRYESLITLPNNNSAIDISLLIKYWKHLKEHPKSLGWVIAELQKEFKATTPQEEKELETAKILFDLTQLDKYWKSFVGKEMPENQTLSNFRYFLALSHTTDHAQELTLATVHTTKGLEFEIVFLIGMNDGVFPDYRAKTEYALQEEKNNLYVAITRAKRVLYITYPGKRQMPWNEEKKQSISRFLNNIQPK